jgi:pilus assembly protein CpaF
VITCEEVFELRVPLPDVVAMQVRQPNLEGAGEIALRRLVKEALRMRPSRIVVGEVRQAEALDLLLCLNSGVPGMCSLHANSAREALVKMCTLPLLAGENVGHAFVVPTVAASIDLVVHLEIDHSGRRRVREIVAVPGRVEGGVIEAADVFTTRANRLVRADGYPPHAERFERLGIELPALLAEQAGAQAPARPPSHSTEPGPQRLPSRPPPRWNDCSMQAVALAAGAVGSAAVAGPDPGWADGGRG